MAGESRPLPSLLNHKRPARAGLYSIARAGWELALYG